MPVQDSEPGWVFGCGAEALQCWDQPGEQSSGCGAEAGEESSSQRPSRDARWDEAGLDVLVCHPQWESLVEGLCGVRVGLGAEPGGCSPRNMSTTLPFCALKETAFEICPSFRVSSWLP